MEVVERKTQDLPKSVLFVLAPTRVLFESQYMKRIGIKTWSMIFLCVNLLFLFCLPWLKVQIWAWSYILVWAIPFSRIFEIAYAFYNDALDQMQGAQPRSGLRRVDRLKLLGQSYVEVAICYASLYLSLPQNSFTAAAPKNAFESLYFSWITITTTGFGDITPNTVSARFAVMTEIGTGLMLIVFALGMYFSYKEIQSQDEES